RIARWRKKLVFDAPTGLTEHSLFSFLNDGSVSAADAEYVTGFSETDSDTPNPYPLLAEIERHALSS
ncbi:MAG: hypothetical protein AAB776_01620, partial [Patescibacteria group bacterium]